MNLAGSVPSAKPGLKVRAARKPADAPRPVVLVTASASRPFSGPILDRDRRWSKDPRPTAARAAQGNGGKSTGTGVVSGVEGLLRSLTGTKSVSVECDVFLAGASGQTGARIIKALVRGGAAVRAAVPNRNEALALKQAAVDFGYLYPAEARKVEIVECNFAAGDEAALRKAMGRCQKVVLTVGEGENGPNGTFSEAMAAALVRAADATPSVTHVVAVVPSNDKAARRGGWRLNNDLLQKLTGARKAADGSLVRGALEKAKSVDFTIVNTTRLVNDDTSPFNHPFIGPAGEAGGEHVSRAQLAEALAVVVDYPEVARNKVLCVSSTSQMPDVAMEDQINGVAGLEIPSRATARPLNRAGTATKKPGTAAKKAAAKPAAVAAAPVAAEEPAVEEVEGKVGQKATEPAEVLDLEAASAAAVGDYGGVDEVEEEGATWLAPLTRMVRASSRPRGIVNGRPKGVPPATPTVVPGFSKASAPARRQSEGPTVLDQAIANSRRPAAPSSSITGKRRSFNFPRKGGGGPSNGDTLEKARSAMDVLNERAAEVAAACAKVEEADKLARDYAQEAEAALREAENAAPTH